MGGSFVVTRTIGVTPRGSMARQRSSTWLGWSVPCSASKTRKSQPSSATYSMSDGSAVRTKAPNAGSPAASFAFVAFCSMTALAQSIRRLTTSSHRSDDHERNIAAATDAFASASVKLGL